MASKKYELCLFSDAAGTRGRLYSFQRTQSICQGCRVNSAPFCGGSKDVLAGDGAQGGRACREACDQVRVLT